MSITEAIGRLASAELSVRVEAAAELYRAGRGPAESAIAPWLTNAELATLLLYPNPEITVGIAVPPELFSAIRATNGNSPLSDVPPEQDAHEFELHFPDNISLDILTPREPAGSGAIARYLQRFGAGIQQVEFRCRNVERTTELVRDQLRLAPVYPQARAGANGTRINFFLVPAGSGKLLIEFYEPTAQA